MAPPCKAKWACHDPATSAAITILRLVAERSRERIAGAFFLVWSRSQKFKFQGKHLRMKTEGGGRPCLALSETDAQGAQAGDAGTEPGCGKGAPSAPTP